MKRLILTMSILTIATNIFAIEPEIKQMLDSNQPMQNWRGQQFIRAKDFESRGEHQKAHEIREHASEVADRAKFSSDLAGDLSDK